MIKSAISIGSLSTLLLLAAPAHAQVPTPFDFVSQLDLECRPAQGAPPAPQVGVRQLNPVLKDQIPPMQVPLGPLEEVCVPVAKNGQIPSQPARAFIERVDVACYRAISPPVGVDLHLTHLNPVLANLLDEDVTLGQLEQICLPVNKNNAVLPPAVKQLVSHFDLGCYALEEPTRDADRTLVLAHLNPVIRAMQFPNRVVDLHRAHQLCVPIGKNAQPVPPGVLDIVEWADFLKYRVVPHDPIPPLPLWLSHLNPLYQQVAPFFVQLLGQPVRLMVPVAKDGHFPPGD
jgi:hypothetical protein